MNKYLSIITLNVNRLNNPIKNERIAEWIRKHDQHIYCLQKTHLRTKDIHKLEVKGWEKNIPSNWTGKNCWGSNTYIRQNRLQTKAMKRGNEGHFIILKVRIHQENINIVHIYAPKTGAPKI